MKKALLVVLTLSLSAAACGTSPTAPADVPCNYRDACIRWTQPDWNAADTARALHESQRR